MFLGPLFMTLVLAATVAIIVLAVRWIIGAQQGVALGTSAQTPIDILKERFAKGEIDKDEFEERRRVLDGRSSSA